MIKVEGINQYYGQSHTLWDFSMEVMAGTCTALIGRNGVGKTTLLKCVMGLLPVRSGSMRFDGADLLALPAERRNTLIARLIEEEEGTVYQFDIHMQGERETVFLEF